MAAYTENFGSGGVSNTSVAPLADNLLATTTDNGFILPFSARLVAAYATHVALSSARVVAPSLLRTAYPYIRPINVGASNPTDPNVSRFISNPLTLAAGENVAVEVTTTGPGRATVLFWLAQQLTPVPPGDKFTLQFTSTDAAVANVWTDVGTITFSQSLPAGKYAVTGMEHFSENGIAARLGLASTPARPGTLSMAGSDRVGARTDRIFTDGGLGVYGYFDSSAPPTLEVLCSSADADHEGYLTVVRVG